MSSPLTYVEKMQLKLQATQLMNERKFEQIMCDAYPFADEQCERTGEYFNGAFEYLSNRQWFTDEVKLKTVMLFVWKGSDGMPEFIDGNFVENLDTEFQ